MDTSQSSPFKKRTKTTTFRFLDLPVEIITYIVHLVDLQDRRYRDRVLDDSDDSDDSDSDDDDDKPDWYGRGISALFFVNKEINLLSAVKLFKVLRHDSMDSPAFLYLISKRRCKNFDTINLGDNVNPASTPSTLLSMLSVFSNVNTITASPPPTWLLPHEAEFGEPFDTISAQIKVLKIDDRQTMVLNKVVPSLPITVRLLNIFSHIQSLSITTDEFTCEKHEAISQLQNLHSLVIRTESILLLLPLPPASNLINLSLTYTSAKWDQVIVAGWIQSYLNLEKLELFLFWNTRQFDQLLLPKLTSLFLDTLSTFATSFLDLFPNSNIHHLALSASSLPSNQRINIVKYLGRFPTLKTLHYRSVEFNITLVAETRFFSQSRGINFVLDDQGRMTRSRNFEALGSKSKDLRIANLIRKEIEDIFSYGARRVAKLAEEGDLVRMKELADTLLGLRKLHIRDEKD